MSNEIEISETKIKELAPYQGRFKVEFKVIEKSEERSVGNKNNPDETHRIADIKVADDSASIILSAWDDDIDFLEQDKCYSLVNGYVNVFMNSLRLGKGKYGSFEPIDGNFDISLENDRSEEKHQPRRRKNFRKNKRSPRRDRDMGYYD